MRIHHRPDLGRVAGLADKHRFRRRDHGLETTVAVCAGVVAVVGRRACRWPRHLAWACGRAAERKETNMNA